MCSDLDNNKNYSTIPVRCKSKRKFFEKGWNAAKNGEPTSSCPYKPYLQCKTGLVPTNVSFKFWHYGYESYKNQK